MFVLKVKGLISTDFRRVITSGGDREVGCGGAHPWVLMAPVLALGSGGNFRQFLLL